MVLSRPVKVIITVVIIAILVGVTLVELQTYSERNILAVSDTKLSIYYNLTNEYLKVDAKITNMGKVNATNIVLFIQTFYDNGTESANWNMTLWQNVTVPAVYSEIDPVNVTIDAGQSYFVQSGNWVMTNDVENPLFPYGYPLVYFQLRHTSFYASYKITPYYQSV